MVKTNRSTLRHYTVLGTVCHAGQQQLPCEAKKLHRFIFAIALSELHLLRQFLAHMYLNKFPIIPAFYILYVIRDWEPA